MIRSLFNYALALVFNVALFLPAQGVAQNATKQHAWKIISPLFDPPKAYSGNFGTYASPLKFYDGRAVRNKKEWSARRQEILSKWHNIMGAWPELIKGQQLQLTDSTRRENFTQYRISLEWIPGTRTQGYLLVPDGEEKKPAVITVYYEPETAIGLGPHPYRDFAYQLAKRGFVTLSLGTTEGTAAKTFSLYYPDLQHASLEPLSALAYAAANAFEALALYPKVDSTRIGIMGHSYGGKWALFASCLYEKFACASWSDPGIVFDNKEENANYWEPWYLGYHPQPWRTDGLITPENSAKGAYAQLTKEGHDLTELHALMAPRPFLVSGGNVDVPERWTALNHAIAVNKLLGFKNRVAMSNRPDHSPNAESNEMIYSFFQFFLAK